ncbi:hypothetical protein YH65_05905 [Sulfurovum lithotrophicum]|uniref:2TM domain-containing protein n=1 Tax=Sulfurovum lithotrophicum TaxID=206403 RepID=A0A7U4M178_9BACT|nr:hypothetical protein [Sulfurovum lithotrophicum]AKF24976.1 hypothetical protein YH65_05905 [Sulfurovum lithotrophicum]
MRSTKKKTKISLRYKIALFTVYFVLFIALTAMIDYYAYDLINPWIFIVLSFVGAIWATLVHVKSKEKSKADELAHDLEEII